MAGGDVIGLARTVFPLLPHHGLSTKHVDTEARFSAAGYSPDDSDLITGFRLAGKDAMLSHDGAFAETPYLPRMLDKPVLPSPYSLHHVSV